MVTEETEAQVRADREAAQKYGEKVLAGEEPWKESDGTPEDAPEDSDTGATDEVPEPMDDEVSDATPGDSPAVVEDPTPSNDKE